MVAHAEFNEINSSRLGLECQGDSLLFDYGFAIAVALGIQVLTATLIGALLPIAAARTKFDPAIVASPALSTIVDITGLFIYFTTVKLLLGI
ncbi:MAG: magnesium transporter [Deltaproteobacteria bacterium]|nr:magnesium transporter [Deltaproteobacteria bacterium]